MSLRPPAPFLKTFCFALSLKGEGGGFDLVEAHPRSPSGSGGPLLSFLEEHEVTSSSIERKARKNLLNSPQNPRINSGK